MLAERLTHLYIYFDCLQATELQTRYMELLTLSGDYYRFLGDLLKNMEELKVILLSFGVSLNICTFVFIYHNLSKEISKL